MSYTSAEKAKIMCEATCSFRGGEFTVFSNLVVQVRLFLFGVLGGRTGFTRNKRLLLVFVLVALVRRGGLTLRLVGLLLRRMTAAFPTCLFFSFPITTINGLSQGSECGECDGLSYSRHFIFDTGRKSMIELVSERAVILSCNCREAIKLDEIFSDALSGLHRQVFEFAFGFADYVRRFEVSLQLRDEFSVITLPGRWV